MSKINTKDRILQAGLELFLELGFQKTSIARIEREAGLVPRAGAFYRHFESKEALLLEVARTHVSETPEEFGFDKLAAYGDTRAELVAIALKYEEAALRQKPFARLIEEVRLLDFGAEIQDQLDADMMSGLEAWIRSKPAAAELSKEARWSLIISIIGGWLFFLDASDKGTSAGQLRDTMLSEWSTRWAAVLDAG